MNYKVFIVDDEPMIRFGLASCIQWELEGFLLAGEASNGEAALESIRQSKVDILITDIKMPMMDGLELTRQVKKIYPDIIVILISSYSDFEYAREAVQLGVVVDYLLKPTMEPVDLLRIMQRCKALLEDEAILAQEAVIYKNQIRIDELKKWINGEYVHFDRLTDWLKEPFVIVVWKLEGFGPQPQLSLQLQKARDLLLHSCAEGLTFIHGEQQLITALSYKKGNAISEIQKLHQRLMHQEGICFTVGISESVHERVRISDAYQCASRALEQAFFDGKGRCFIGLIGSNTQADSLQLHLPLWKDLKERFSKSYADANREQCEQLLRDCFNLWMLGVFKKMEIISQARSLATIIWFGNNHLKTDELIIGMLEKLQQMLLIDTLPDLQRFMIKELSDLWDVNQFSMKAADSGSTHAIQLSLSYIQENYRDELSLQDAADHVHMSRNYYSEQFKRVMGLNFIDFVIRLRIHYAMQLLRQTNLKVYDIGEQAGFHSSKHFLKLFKRVANCTPAEFRQNQDK